MENTNQPKRILRFKQVQEVIPFSRSYVYNLISKGKFPKPIKLIAGGRGAGWWSDEIDEYLKQRYKDTRGGKGFE